MLKVKYGGNGKNIVTKQHGTTLIQLVYGVKEMLTVLLACTCK